MILKVAQDVDVVSSYTAAKRKKVKTLLNFSYPQVPYINIDPY